MTKILAIARLVLFAIFLLGYLLTILILSLFVGDKTRASRPLRRPTIKLFLFFLGVRIHQTGVVPNDTVLFVGNHISYLDPFILVYHTIAWPVAKNEIASWPLIGYAVSLSGVLFVKRLNANSLKATRDAITKTLKEGKSVIVYPEGTTSDGYTMLPFRRGVFDIACNNGIPVVPVSILFKNENASFLKKIKFLPHFLTLFSSWRNDVYIHFGDKIKESDGKTCMELAHEVIEDQVEVLRKSMK